MKLLIISLILLSGCFFARVDYEKDGLRVSGTLWTIGKNYYIDPNSMGSYTDKLKVIYPPVMVETE